MPKNTTYRPQGPNLKKSISHIIYLLCISQLPAFAIFHFDCPK